mmetsp:Transcript_101952/g.256896  ORF Transcript_101952/g.256896 Transcript_101952/m.256896 type:complete len:194 (+) Transcript_101952:89-670(+)
MSLPYAKGRISKVMVHARSASPRRRAQEEVAPIEHFQLLFGFLQPSAWLSCKEVEHADDDRSRIAAAPVSCCTRPQEGTKGSPVERRRFSRGAWRVVTPSAADGVAPGTSGRNPQKRDRFMCDSSRVAASMYVPEGWEAENGLLKPPVVSRRFSRGRWHVTRGVSKDSASSDNDVTTRPHPNGGALPDACSLP